MLENKSGFRIISIIVASVMTIGTFGVLIGPFSDNVSATITGDTYSGSGNFILTQNTVYDGTDLHVYGNIYIAGGSLTIRDATLTMEEAYQYQNNIYVNWSETQRAFIMSDSAILTPSNSSEDGQPMLKILPAVSCNIYIDHSTVEHTWIQTNEGTNAWLDNSTFHASRFYGIYNQGSGSLNISTSTFKDYAGWGLITTSLASSIVTANTFTNITQTEDPAYNYRAMITVYGDGTTGNVRILKNHFVKVELNGINVKNAWSVRISRNIFDNLTSTSEGLGATVGITARGDGKKADLSTYSYVDGNTFKFSMGDPAYWGTTAIALGDDAKHWYVMDNDIWTLNKPYGGYESIGIGVGGGTVASGTSFIYVLNNHFGNVTGDYDTPGGQSKAINIKGEGSISGPFTTTDVLVDGNTIDLVKNSALGIEIRYMVSDTKVSNNTIGLLRGYDSSGIGVYNEPCRILISDNNITMWRDVWGINLAHNHTYATVVRNTIHILAQATWHDEGIYANVRGGGAIAINDEDDSIYLPLENHWTADGDVLAYNHITRDSFMGYFPPSYTILNASHGNVGPYLSIILDQNADIWTYNSTFTITILSSSRLVPVVVDHNGNKYPPIFENGQYVVHVSFNPTDGLVGLNITSELPYQSIYDMAGWILAVGFGVGISAIVIVAIGSRIRRG